MQRVPASPPRTYASHCYAAAQPTVAGVSVAAWAWSRGCMGEGVGFSLWSCDSVIVILSVVMWLCACVCSRRARADLAIVQAKQNAKMALKLELIQTNPLFDCLDSTQRDSLAKSGEIVHYAVRAESVVSPTAPTAQRTPCHTHRPHPLPKNTRLPFSFLGRTHCTPLSLALSSYSSPRRRDARPSSLSHHIPHPDAGMRDHHRSLIISLTPTQGGETIITSHYTPDPDAGRRDHHQPRDVVGGDLPHPPRIVHDHITSHHITSHHITSHHITSHHMTWQGSPTVPTDSPLHAWLTHSARTLHRTRTLLGHRAHTQCTHAASTA
jgi:hypothetical protein